MELIGWTQSQRSDVFNCYFAYAAMEDQYYRIIPRHYLSNIHSKSTTRMVLHCDSLCSFSWILFHLCVAEQSDTLQAQLCWAEKLGDCHCLRKHFVAGAALWIRSCRRPSAKVAVSIFDGKKNISRVQWSGLRRQRRGVLRHLSDFRE